MEPDKIKKTQFCHEIIPLKTEPALEKDNDQILLLDKNGLSKTSLIDDADENLKRRKSTDR